MYRKQIRLGKIQHKLISAALLCLLQDILYLGVGPIHMYVCKYVNMI